MAALHPADVIAMLDRIVILETAVQSAMAEISGRPGVEITGPEAAVYKILRDGLSRKPQTWECFDKGCGRMSLPATWTECHEEVSRAGEAQPCNGIVVALRSDLSDGRAADDPRSWYPVCAKHSRAPMVNLWRGFSWAVGEDA